MGSNKMTVYAPVYFRTETDVSSAGDNSRYLSSPLFRKLRQEDALKP